MTMVITMMMMIANVMIYDIKMLRNAAHIVLCSTLQCIIINYNIIALLLCLCILPLAFTTNIPPTVPKSPSLNVWKTFILSPLSFMTVFVVGATNSAIRMLGPVYGQDSGFTQLEIGIFLSLALIGGVVAQIPIG